MQAQLNSQRHHGGAIRYWANVGANHGAQLTGCTRFVASGGVLFNHLDLAGLLASHTVLLWVVGSHSVTDFLALQKVFAILD
jgi:hypothetical protein